MKNIKSTIRLRHQCVISAVLFLSTFNAFASNDNIKLATEQLLQQLSQSKQVKPTLHFENNELRVFSEKNADLSREQVELLTAVDVFDQHFGPSPKFDIALMDSQMSLLRLDVSEMSDKFLGMISYQGLTKIHNISDHKAAKYNIVGHEACHMLLINQVEEKGLNFENNGELVYGHGLLPDWFDEMTAVMCENQALVDMRLTVNIDKFIPFNDFFVMENPAFSIVKAQMSQLMQQQLKKSNDDKDSRMEVIQVDEYDKNTQLAELFYQQAALFHHFLKDKLGSQIFKRLTQEFVQKSDIEAWLLQQLSLNKVTELDVMFKQFYQQNRL